MPRMFYPIRLLYAHIETAYNVFDTIVRVPTGSEDSLSDFRDRLQMYNQKIKHRYFILPLLLMIYYLVDTVYQLSTVQFDYFSDPLEEMLSHQIYPRAFWVESDIIASAIVLTCLVVYVGLITRPFIPTEFDMFIVGRKLIVNNRVWDSTNAAELIQFRARSKHALKVFYLVSWIFLYIYFCINFWSYSKINLRNVLNIFVIFPIMFYYTCFGVLFFFYSFFIALRYIVIKQRFLLSKLRALHDSIKLNRELNGRVQKRFQKVNKLFINQCNENREYDKFWCFYLSLQFQCVTVIACYMAYCLIFIESNLIQKLYYWYFLLLLVVSLSVILWQCAGVDFRNDNFAKIRIHTLLLCRAARNVPAIVNFEKVSCNFNGQQYCFHFGTGYSIDSSFLSLALVVVTTLFMRITQNSIH